MTPRPYRDCHLPPTIRDAASLAADLDEAIEIWRADLQPLFRSWIAAHRTVIELLEDFGSDDLPHYAESRRSAPRAPSGSRQRPG